MTFDLQSLGSWGDLTANVLERVTAGLCFGVSVKLAVLTGTDRKAQSSFQRLLYFRRVWTVKYLWFDPCCNSMLEDLPFKGLWRLMYISISSARFLDTTGGKGRVGLLALNGGCILSFRCKEWKRIRPHLNILPFHSFRGGRAHCLCFAQQRRSPGACLLNLSALYFSPVSLPQNCMLCVPSAYLHVPAGGQSSL